MKKINIDFERCNSKILLLLTKQQPTPEDLKELDALKKKRLEIESQMGNFLRIRY